MPAAPAQRTVSHFSIKGAEAGALTVLIQKWTDSNEQLTQESAWSVQHYEVVATIESHKLLARRHNARDIVLCQFHGRLLVMGALKEENWHIERSAERR